MAGSSDHDFSFIFFTPNCSYPPVTDRALIVRGAEIRDTLTIIWSSLSVLVLCTWTILHLNVPQLRRVTESSWDGFINKTWWMISGAFTKVKWMLFTTLAPELMLAKSANEVVAACEWDRARGSRSDPVVRNYLSNMGHFILDTEESAESARVSPIHQGRSTGAGEMTIRKCLEEIKVQISRRLRKDRNDRFHASKRINAERLRGRFWALTARQWEVLAENQIVHLPNIPEDQLARLDSSGGFVKLLAIIQISWLIIQLSVRHAYGHPSSQLEIAVLGFAAQSALTYVCNWSRPQGVEVVRIIDVNLDQPIPRIDPERFEGVVTTLIKKAPKYLWSAQRLPSSFDNNISHAPIPNDGFHTNAVWSGEKDKQIIITSIIVAVGGALFGGIHCLAWSSHFPTAVDALIWRGSCVSTIILPALCVPIALAWESLKNYSPETGSIYARVDMDDIDRQTRMVIRNRLLLKAIGIVLFILYTVGRTLLIVEMVRTLLYLPPDVYKDTWSQEVPHFG